MSGRLLAAAKLPKVSTACFGLRIHHAPTSGLSPALLIVPRRARRTSRQRRCSLAPGHAILASASQTMLPSRRVSNGSETWHSRRPEPLAAIQGGGEF